MKTFELNTITKKNIEKVTGISYNDLMWSYDSSQSKSIFSSKRDLRKIGRGNPLLSRRKIRTITTVNERLERMK